MKNKYFYLFAVCVTMFLAWYYIGRNEDASVTGFGYSADFEETPSGYEVLGKAYILGEVVNPGVYELTSDTRIEDLIEMAGGVTDGADLTRVNLSARVRDEQKVTIPSKDSVPEDDGLIDLNSATEEQLMSLPGIGGVTAEAIIKYRESNGGFVSIDELLNIYNIGQKTFDRIKDKVKVS